MAPKIAIPQKQYKNIIIELQQNSLFPQNHNFMVCRIIRNDAWPYGECWTEDRNSVQLTLHIMVCKM